jgi:hypothetical protein
MRQIFETWPAGAAKKSQRERADGSLVSRNGSFNSDLCGGEEPERGDKWRIVQSDGKGESHLSPTRCAAGVEK